MKLIYVANARLPTEKAHGLQIMQNCEAFAEAGAAVTLWVARRQNTPELAAVSNVWSFYGVRANFALRRLFTIDLLPYVGGDVGVIGRALFALQQITFTLAVLAAGMVTRADVFYSRDPFSLLALSLIQPRRKLAYEAHMLAQGRIGRWVQRWVVRRVGTVIAITGHLARDLAALGGDDPPRFQVAHDGIRRERFTDLPSQAEARRAVGWPEGAFIAGYVGRLQSLAVDKGVGTLVEALGLIEGAALGVVGGPDEMAAALRERWLALGRPAEHFLAAGQVTPERVPLYLSAMDIGVIPLPNTRQFAYYTSPMKLFEYMAAGRAVVASDLPGIAEVVQDGESALLVPAGDAAALGAAIRRLRDDPALRARLGERARQLAFEQYTWDARARGIMQGLGVRD